MTPDQTIQQFFRSTAITYRITEQVGPFLAAYQADSAFPWLNYAVPDDEADPTDADVRKLIAWYRQRERTPRLEYLPSRSPLVRAVLEHNGFIVEAEMPLMIAFRDDLVAVPDPARFEIAVAESRESVRAALAVQHDAFGDPPPDDATIDRHFKMVQEDMLLLLARDLATGESAGAAMTLRPLGGVTEVAGIAVRESFRRRGLAAALTYRVSELAIKQGTDTLFLSPASDEGERIYGRVGYRSVSGILHMTYPGAEPTV